ncbi:MAG: hypothetical protein A2231_06805 [Candidatus Firestonebacteria bacterium RIFOXYA2_FULL_40_8]|nr:MAG: hypothetical protein A2231_06805 [Candidatus Firestonebacteria bacterium RIFOXYA2_FULL_40_8]
MKKSKKKVSFWGKPSVQLMVLAGIILCCVIGYFVYNLPSFWVRPATVEFSPEEGQGLYLGMSVSELKAIKAKASLYKNGKLFKNYIYYDRKIGGKHFDNGSYNFSTYGRLANLVFSRHFKADKMEKEKYEYLKYFIAKYGADYKKGVCIYKPYSNKKFVYDMFIWEKKDARIVLEYSFYENNKDGYYFKNMGIYLNMDYPKTSSEGAYTKVIEDPANPELQEAFKQHFPELEKKLAEPVAPKKTK